MKLSPFWFYLLLYPLKSNSSYIFDEHTGSKVDYLGSTASMQEDLFSFLRELGYAGELAELERKNSSNHKPWQFYFKSSLSMTIFKMRNSKELKLYGELFNKVS